MERIFVAGISRTSTLCPTRQQWQAGLPDVLADCAARWGLDVGYPLEARTSHVIRAVRNGRPVVLKLAPPGPKVQREERVLAAAAGRGYVRLLESRVESGALLLEGLGRNLDSRLQSEPSTGDELTRLYATLLERVWQLPVQLAEEPDERSHPARLLAQRIRALSACKAAQHHRPVIERALRYADQRWEANDPRRHVIVHGDPHPGHVCALPAGRSPAGPGEVLVDPGGFRCEREYDLAAITREANRAILNCEDAVVALRHWCANLAEATGTDAEAIWQWSFLQRVARGLEFLTEQKAHDEGRLYLQTASLLITRRPGCSCSPHPGHR